MRTTVNIDDDVLRRAKDEARASGRSLGEVLEASLQSYLGASRDRQRVALPSFGAGGLLPGIDPTSNASMFDAADRERSPDGALRE